MNKSMPALVIAVMLTCSISFAIIVYALPGDLIWKKTANPSNRLDVANGVAVDSNSIYIVGYDESPAFGDYRWRMEKRSATTGSLIWVKTCNPSNSWDRAYGVAVDSSGVYVVGFDKRPGNARWRIEKRGLDGSRTWLKTRNPSGGWDAALGVAVDGSTVYIVGYDSRLGNSRWRIEKRSTTDGGLIWTKTCNPSSNDDAAFDVAVDGSGVYVVGYDEHTGDRRWRIEKRSTTDGGLIWKKAWNPSSEMDMALGVAVDGTGVYIAGWDQHLGLGDRRWRMEKRSLVDGSRIWTKTSNPSSSWDQASGVAVYGASVYVVGSDKVPGDDRWRMEKRSTADGSLFWKKTVNPSSSHDVANGVAVDGTSVYIVGYDSKPGHGDGRWRIERRVS